MANPSRSFELDKIAAFKNCTGASANVALAYLDAEEGILSDAVRSYRADQEAELVQEVHYDALGGYITYSLKA